MTEILKKVLTDKKARNASEINKVAFSTESAMAYWAN